MVKYLALVLFPIAAIAQPSPSAKGSFTDSRDGNSYNWVRIGNQVWMADNLAYEPYGSGSYVYDYNEELVDTYGRLYTWDIAVDVCPSGWHLPESWEYEELYSNFGKMKTAGGALKSRQNWKTPNTGATNSSGFNALPAGGYSGKLYLTFNSLKLQSYFWTSTEVDNNTARVLQLGYNHSAAYDLSYHSKKWGLSVRCIKDAD